MEPRSENLPVTLPSGKTVQLQVMLLGREEDVAARGIPSIEGLTQAIEGLSASILESLVRIKPKKATVHFGITVALESGNLTALLVKGAGNASIDVSLEWGSED